jgi:hypothetical protein
MDTMRRLAATLSIVALLACSSMGTCWAMLAAAGSGHDCCESGASLAAPAKACASTLATVSPVDVAAPAEAPVALLELGPAAYTAPVHAFAPAFPVLAPPLILRI